MAGCLNFPSFKVGHSGMSKEEMNHQEVYYLRTTMQLLILHLTPANSMV